MNFSREAAASLAQYTARIHELNGAPANAESFNVSPNVAQAFENRLKQKYTFLSLIKSREVTQLKGQKLGLPEGQMIAKRTGTGLRKGTSPNAQEQGSYELFPVEYDIFIPWSTVDSWAGTDGFQDEMRNYRLGAVGGTRQTVGFNGVAAESVTDPVANPLGQDVNRGWLQAIRDDSPESVLPNVTVGAGGDYKTLDAMVIDAIGQAIHEVYEGSNLVAITGSNLLSNRLFSMASEAKTPTEAAALASLYSGKVLGGIPAIRVPGMPRDRVLITPLDNLAYYHQKDSRRETLKNDDDAKAIKHFLYLNEAYVVEDYRACALIDGVTIIE